MKTFFASPERAAEQELKSEIELAARLPLINELTHIIPDAFVILNRQRQIIYGNKTLMNMLGLEDSESITGLRLGEALQCIHAKEEEGGCGTTKYCRQCGAVNAMVKSQADPESVKEEDCRLTAGDENQAYEFKIRANTMDFDGKLFTIVVAQNDSHEKRRYALERTFFHDILNTAGGIQGIIELMKDASAEDMAEFIKLAESSSQTLVEEIHAQRELLAAENGQLELEFIPLNTFDIIESVAAIYKNHPVSEGKTIVIDDRSDGLFFSSDPRLLIRVLGNMLKNGLEAEPEGQTLKIGAKKRPDVIEFWVQNPRVIPEEIQLQIFQRSFSTKGTGRGLGTYSIKLLGEKYLKGKAAFISNSSDGTVFSISLPAGHKDVMDD